MTDPRDAARYVLRRCADLGFAAAGVCHARPSDRAAELRAWLDAGAHGSMDYLARHVDARVDPARVLPGCRSIIVVADVYAPRDREPPADTLGHRAGRIARYARGRDYHRVIKKRLHRLADELREREPGHRFRTVVDTAPVLEREHAARAGIGWIAKHTLIIHPRLGSYLLLGAVLTTLELEPPEDQRVHPDHCGSCTRCIDACPTGAITPHRVDASRCIAYLTIERRLPIDDAWFEPIGDWLAGCDVCQEVCPHNSPRHATTPQPLLPDHEPRRTGFDVLDVLNWTEQDRRQHLAGSALTWLDLAMLKRNAVIVAGNALRRADDPALRARLASIASDDAEPATVRSTARRVLDRLDRPSAGPSAAPGPR